MVYVLHYAPDNASLIVRMALEHRGLAYRTQLVNRATREQEGAAFRSLNPHGLIPVLETPQGPIFETGAILLWLADTHGGLGLGPHEDQRGAFLKWLFYLSNTTHATLRMMFYTEKYITADGCADLRRGAIGLLGESFGRLEGLAASHPGWLGGAAATVLDFYLCALLRWTALYPDRETTAWFDLKSYPAMLDLCHRIEHLPCMTAVERAEGLGPTPFTRPAYPNPPEGTAT